MLKSTGIVRKVDELGRIVLPIELRRTLDIVEKDPLEIYVDGERIILKKYEPTVDSPRSLIMELLKTGEATPELIQRMREAVS
jgi:AbrB family looped-hinge helix DNA binding protein